MTSINDPKPVLEVSKVTKIFPGARPVTAIDDLSLQVCAGELVALVGASGSGKSTLLAIMGGLDVADSGTIRIAGNDLSGVRDAQRSALRASVVGFVFQQYFLLPHLDAAQNVAMGLLYSGVCARTRRERAQTALEIVGLGARSRHRPSQLSGGEQQRVAVARALIASPALILADEPTGALDSVAGNNVMQLLADIAAEGTAVVVVTHDHAIADSLPRRIVLRDGRIVTDEIRTA